MHGRRQVNWMIGDRRTLRLSCPRSRNCQRTPKEFTVTTRCPKFLVAAALAVVSMAGASAYIEYPPTTMAKLCQSPRIRLLKVTKFDKEKGVVVFELVENLNTPNDKVK